MTDDQGTLRAVDWPEVVPGLLLLRSFRVAKEFPKLVLAATALLLTAGGWWALGAVFSGAPDVAAATAATKAWPWEAVANPQSTDELRAAGSWVVGRLGLESQLDQRDVAWLARNPVIECWLELSHPFRELFSTELSLSAFTYRLLCGIWAAAVWGLFGGAITRIAAVELARDERVGAKAALAYSRARFAAYAQAPLTPLVLVGMVVAFVSLAGWLLRFDAGVVVAAVAWPLFLLGGFVAAIVVLGLMFGWPLMWATISVEGTDSFDAISRSYCYVFQRPLQTAVYAVTASAYGVFCWLLAAAFAAGIVHLTLWSASWAAGRPRLEAIVAQLPQPVLLTGLGRPAGDVPIAPASAETSTGNADDEQIPAALGGAGRLGVLLIAGWIGLVKLLTLGFAYSFFWTSATAIYLLLRKHVDNAELDEIQLDSQPEAFSLPPLKHDEAGVPIVIDEAPADPRAETHSSSA